MSLASKEGNSKAAIYWAQKKLAYGILEKGAYSERIGRIADDKILNYHLGRESRSLAEAYRLDGQEEMALLWYAIEERAGEKDFVTYEISISPLALHLRNGYRFFEQQKLREAFEYFCKYGKLCLEKYADELAHNTGNDRNGTLKKIRGPIITCVPRLLSKYTEFLVFMEEEYVKLGHPTEYAEVMELFRTIYSEIGEEDVNPSGASDSLSQEAGNN